MSVQTTIQFAIRKKSFYGGKDDVQKEDFSNASLRNTPTTRYTPTVKKLVEISSSESDSDSDAENIAIKNNNIKNTPKRGRRKNNSNGK